VAATVLVALPVGRFICSLRAARIVGAIRRVQTGSVNDYAGYLVLGALVAVVSLGAGR
jgi:hypothetical protein